MSKKAAENMLIVNAKLKSNESRIMKRYFDNGWIIAHKGFPDLFMMKKGKKRWSFVAIECKFGKSKLTREQRLVKRMLRILGVEYIIHRTKKVDKLHYAHTTHTNLTSNVIIQTKTKI